MGRNGAPAMLSSGGTVQEQRAAAGGMRVFILALVAGVACNAARDQPINGGASPGQTGSATTGGTGDQGNPPAGGAGPTRGNGAGDSSSDGGVGTSGAAGAGAGCGTIGATRCAAVGAAIEVCTLSGTWVMQKTCPSTCAD